MKHRAFFSHPLRALALTPSVLACDIGVPSSPSPLTAQDQPSICTPEEVPRYLELREPYVQQARLTYPDAKSRYQAGLPSGQHFYLTTAFPHADGGAELVFIEVSQIEDEVVKGSIATEPIEQGFFLGQPYEFTEAAILDWTIVHPDGTEEGNFVGRFLDSFEGQCPR